MDLPTRGTLIDLVKGLCLIEDKIRGEHGMPSFLQDPKVSNVEALKIPMFYVWHKLDYGHSYTLSPRGANAYWLASFKTDPGAYIAECIRLLQHSEIPYVDMSLRNSLINFYSELSEAYNL